MKKNNENNKERKSIFSWKKPKKDELLFAQKEKGIRHVEDSLSFLNETNNIEGSFGQTENMYDTWGLNSGDASLKRKKRKVVLRLMIAVAVTLFILSSIFYILPRVLPGFFKGSNIELFVERDINYEYDSTFCVVGKSVSALREAPDNASPRITEVLYNEPVLVLEGDSGDGYSKVRTMDGISGYIITSDLVDDTTSVEPDLHEYKLIVSETKKNIMTHASNGTLITEVVMNTVLYADVKRDGVYQVYLPGGEMGWIGSSGVIEISPREEIEEVSCRYFVSSALSFVNCTYIENGMSMSGMSVNGLVYVCSCVNGIPMARTVEDQMTAGEEVELQYDVVTGDLIIDDIIPGDVIFLGTPYSSVNASSDVYEMAICTDNGTLLRVSPAGTTIRLEEFTSDSEICSRIITVRRIFS